MSHNDPPRAGAIAEPEWLTLGQAAIPGVAQSTIRKWSDQGRVPAFYTPGGIAGSGAGTSTAFIDRSGPAGSGGAVVLVVDDDPRSASTCG